MLNVRSILYHVVILWYGVFMCVSRKEEKREKSEMKMAALRERQEQRVIYIYSIFIIVFYTST
mgnify:CR=1 FL=1